MGAIGFELTHRCNLRCPRCFTLWGDTGRNELGTGAVIEILRRLRAQGVQSVSFTGGEIFARRDALEIFRAAAAAGLSFALTTNGSHPRCVRDWELLMQFPPAFVSVSVDGPPEAHDRLRGVRGAFARTDRLLSLIEEAGLPCAIQFTFDAEGIRYLPDVLSYASKRRTLRYLKATPALPLGQAGAARALSPQERAYAYELVSRLNGRYRLSIASELCVAADLEAAHAAFRDAPVQQLCQVVQPDGRVFPWYGLSDAWCLGAAAQWSFAEPTAEDPMVALALRATERAFALAKADAAAHTVTDLGACTLLAYQELTEEALAVAGGRIHPGSPRT